MTADEAFQEALRRIAEAERTNADLLDLGDLPLDRLPQELGRLTCLNVLSFGNRAPERRGNEIVWEWRSSGAQRAFTEITPLAELANLLQLDLSSTPVNDVAPLANLANLQQLNLNHTNVTDLAPLAKLRHGEL